MDQTASHKELLARIESLEQENRCLRLEADDLSQIFNMAHDMICIADIRTATFIKVNPAFTKILGLTEDELLGRPFMEFVHPEDLKSTREVMERELKEGFNVLNFENRYRCKDGNYRWLSWVSHPVPSKGITYAMARDITQRKTIEMERAKAQQELIKRNTFIEAIMDNLPIGLGVNDIDTGVVTYLNKKWEDIFGWPGDAFPNVEDFFEKVFPDPAVREPLKQQILMDMASGDPDRMSWDNLEITTRTGKKRIVHAKNIPLMDQNIMISTAQNVTEKRKLEDQVRQSQKIEAIGTLAGGIAHDFNNLLGIIMGNISYALSFLTENNELKEILTDVLEGSKQAQNLTYQLLTFAKGGEPVKQVQAINQLLCESAEFVTRGAKSKCEFHLADDLWAVDVDPGQINQVISNLVINADQAMPSGGLIKITAKNTTREGNRDIQRPKGPYVKISVRDQGIGILPEHMANIFDPYFTTKQKGSGLGLATAYSIVKKHGGHLTAESEPGAGTVFHIYLPASLKHIPEKKVEESQGHQGQGKILIMDDQEAILKMVGKILNILGYETEQAIDGQQAVELYRNAYEAGEPFDLVILDLTVPGGMGGEQTMAELLKIDPNVKAAVSSGYSTDPVMANYRDFGFCGVVPKPYTKKHLAELLNLIF